MAIGNYSIVTRHPGEVLTALEYNTQDHQNHITNNTPAGLAGYSESVAQMQVTTDPLPAGSESFAPHLAGEFERLRFAIKALKSSLMAGTPPMNWYDPMYPASSINKAIVSRANIAGTTVTTGVFTSLTFDTATFNDASIWSGGSPTRLTAPSNGVYAMGFSVHWGQVAAGGQRLIRILLNGATVIAQVSENTSANAIIEQSIQCAYKLTAADFVQCQVFQDSGGNVGIPGTSGVSYSSVAYFAKIGS